jgi:hypothetical protein
VPADFTFIHRQIVQRLADECAVVVDVHFSLVSYKGIFCILWQNIMLPATQVAQKIA